VILKAVVSFLSLKLLFFVLYCFSFLVSFSLHLYFPFNSTSHLSVCVCMHLDIVNKVIPLQARRGQDGARGTRRGEWSATRPAHTLPQGKTCTHYTGGWVGPQGRSGRAENLVPIGIRSRTVQPVVSRYTNLPTELPGQLPRHTLCQFPWMPICVMWGPVVDVSDYLISPNWEGSSFRRYITKSSPDYTLSYPKVRYCS